MKRSAIITVALAFALIVLSLWAFASASAAQCPSKPQYLCPLPGAQLVSPGTTIIIRPGTTLSAAPVSSELFRVAGSVTGIHTGSVVIADDGKTLIFKPVLPFAPGEEVQVDIGPDLRTESGCAVGAISFRFTVSATEPAAQADILRRLAYEELQAPTGAQSPVPAPAVRSLSALPSDFPVITVTTEADDTADGYLFLTPFTPLPGFTAATSFLLIMDNSGQPLYLDEVDGLAFDFKKQPNGLLTYWQLGGTFRVRVTEVLVTFPQELDTMTV